MWHPRRATCHRSADQAAARRLFDEAYKEKPYHDGTREVWAKESSGETPYHYADGVTVWVSTEPGKPGEWP